MRRFNRKRMEKVNNIKVIISGGGTGGHIFPALSIANALKRLDPSVDILFVGALGRMEMEKVPMAGYDIKGLPVSGFDRKHILKNIKVFYNLMRSLVGARRIVKEFKPSVVVGVGGYASGPLLRVAGSMGVPMLIQEQNSYAGVTNRLLAAKASKICVAYDGMERFFPAEKIIKTGNPVRQNFDNLDSVVDGAYEYFGFKKGIPVILVLGGSLGAATINRSLKERIDRMTDSGYQWLWQTGKYYIDDVRKAVEGKGEGRIREKDFINRMDYAFAVADVIVSRAGAGTISELCLVGKPVILVPSPNVAEDHQTKNA
jgi:UDP-N-acetylglucosamine--N-acetylmuramyl-(pentapeptide) pyrophosphoryl-undecaprenol N-acetylglucosamine transferase